MTRDGKVINARGQKVDLPDIKGLRKGLGQMAVKRLMAVVGGPPLQALMVVDSLLKQKFGEGVLEHRSRQQQLVLDHMGIE